MNWLNLGVIILLLYAAKVGQEEGLVVGLSNLFIVFWGAIAAFTFLVPLSGELQKFLIRIPWMARIVSFWLLFLIVTMALWEVLGKKLRQEKIVLFPKVDFLGGFISGLLFGAILSSFLVTSIYMFPLKGRDKIAFAFLKRPVIFRIDELLPRFYGLVTEKESIEGEEKTIYSFEEFMYKYNYVKGKKYKPKKKKEKDQKETG